ncbi:hypothetical protein J2741_000319 [Methanolinea mesophila]|uniref:hypothetical protein n=1 Tax=Methanolinea mesophila TaxID=547055 RepID=UPI001AE9E991|nr:hypothetical protein [Methanolinea mesophila]MBP1927772.1 hypothetical protein [Methanolinea mesophila]
MGLEGGQERIFNGSIVGVAVILGFFMGVKKVLLSENESKTDDIFLVGSGVTITWGVGIAVGVTDGILVGIVMEEGEPVRWLEISSLALMARTGAQTSVNMKNAEMRGQIFILIPRWNYDPNDI